MVASPTPMVPISSDSISRISNPRVNNRDSKAAVIQPAVPPPTMVILYGLSNRLNLRSAGAADQWIVAAAGSSRSSTLARRAATAKPNRIA